MKKLFLLILLVASINKMQSQNNGIVYYVHTDNHYRVNYNAYLVFNQQKSYFVTAKDSLGVYNTPKKTKGINNSEEELVEVTDFSDTPKTREEGLQVYLNKLTDSIYFTNAFSLVSKMIYAKEKRPKLKWSLTDETKKIGKFTCKKASTNFRGRKYIAWYTEEIPLPYGPWKLQGLPGIILEAKSTDGFFKMSFLKIKIPVKNISVPSDKKSLLGKNKIFISFKDYKLKQKREIERATNSLRIAAKKYNVTVEPLNEKENFLEVFGF